MRNRSAEFNNSAEKRKCFRRIGGDRNSAISSFTVAFTTFIALNNISRLPNGRIESQSKPQIIAGNNAYHCVRGTESLAIRRAFQ